ncbi:LacI family DNA-binding transcriptional regulator [Luteolibacter sp. LG18]|uniref:LacI family DNA-binding transcriptional regulator n=1 Tax=Luteolibacter sp. LG18 TaxID=2819286 RepID=UPI002B2EFB42|nr:LacI family transcriptional regulator [Luteolibacter sp. LG18]
MNHPLPHNRITQKDVAQALRLAQSTVSMALRGDPSIPVQTREEVRHAALAMGYRPNPTGAALAHFRASSRHQPVQAALAWLNCWDDPARLRGYREFDCYWEGASKAAHGLGYRLEEFVVNRELTLERFGEILHARNINGILLPPGPTPPGWERFDWSGFSVVRLSQPGRKCDLEACAVAGDQTRNGMLAFDSMQKLGYSRIGYCGLHWQDRLFCAGFLWGQQQTEGEDRIPPLLLSSEQRAEWDSRLETWLEECRPDAILTDLPEMPAMLADAGLRVPQDIGLAAMGTLDCPIDAGIHQNPHEIGRTAVMMLASLINDRIHGVPLIRQTLLIGGSWVNGSSLPEKRTAISRGLSVVPIAAAV